MQDFWPSCGYRQLVRDARNWLQPTDAYLRLFLARPELALLPESCAAERALHATLVAAPSRPVAPAEVAMLRDGDARESYTLFLRFRDGLLAAGTLENYYLGLFRRGAIDVPPLFIDLMAQAVVRHVLDDVQDPVEVRAAEMLFRTQRILVDKGQLLAGDREVLDLLHETGGLGEVGRLLVQGGAPMDTIQMEVLSEANAARYWQASERFDLLLDLSHEVSQTLSHGLVLTMARARSGPKALARVLEKWVAHFLGVAVQIEPREKIEDEAWRWHVGLDVEASALLNDLYAGQVVAAERLARLVCLFRLVFTDRQEMRADVAGKPVYLGLATNAEGLLRLKPQNLLLNLPLAGAM
ncbi:MAG TPA: DUF6352 family protein [Burkholderiaceae bacterium]|nr:DUF6352 family protein [Burkholderiaceae bacterium]